ncbi:hypothetical protein D3C76_1354270 [compost metagenome]
MITAIQLKVLMSGRWATPPRRTRPQREKPMPRLTAKVASISTCQYRPKNLVDQANSVLTNADTASMSTSAAIRNAPRKPPLIRNSGQSMSRASGRRMAWPSAGRVVGFFMMPPEPAIVVIVDAVRA